MRSITQFNGGIASHQEGWHMGMHVHCEAEFSVVLDGRGAVQYGDSILPIASGDVVMISSNLPHSFSSVTPIRFGVAMFECDSPAVQALFRQITGPGHLSVITLSRIELESYDSLFRSCFKFLSQPLSVKRTECHRSAIELLLLYLVQHVNRRPETISLTRVAGYIQTNLKQDIRMSELAGLAGLSESAFRSAFRRTYGIAPKPYQQHCRLSEAKWQLRLSDKTLSEIGESIGFPNLQSFSRWFLTMEGTSASEWRKRQWGQSSSGPGDVSDK